MVIVNEVSKWDGYTLAAWSWFRYERGGRGPVPFTRTSTVSPR
jgi:hypothetical protein